jgi:outer membrane protein
MRSLGHNSLRASLLAIILVVLVTGLGVSQNATPAAPAPQGAVNAAVQTPKPAQPFPDYSKPKGPWYNLLAPYTSRHVQAPSYANSPRIDAVFKDGTMYLSLQDAVALAIENNLDVAIQRYNIPIADTDVLRTKAGQLFRGVAAGIVQGTPGGTSGFTATGSIVGTTIGVGGAGAGAAGQVLSTLGLGPVPSSFDPSITGNIFGERAQTPEATPLFVGAPTLGQNSTYANFTYNQGFATGTNISVGFQNNRITNNSLFSAINPQLNSNFRFTLTQHLLNGLGWGVQTRFIKIAKNDREITDVVFRQQLIFTVSQIQNIYWDLVNAYEDVKVKERSLALAQKTFNDNQKQVEIGTLAPIEVVRAQSQVAQSNQDLIVSQTNLQYQELLMKNAISRNLTDQVLASAHVVPTDTTALPAIEPVVPTEDLVNEALSRRPELAVSRINLQNREISNKGVRNGMLPSLDAYGFYGASGLSGVQNPNCTNVQFGCPPPGAIASTGYTDAFSNLFNSSAPDKGLGVQLNIPIRNRGAQADQVRSELEYRQAQMILQQQENQVRIDVRQTQFALMQNRARVEAARRSVDFSRENLDAEQKKYDLGASTNTLVLQAQRDLSQSESVLIGALTAYEKARVDLDRAVGRTLTKMNINLTDAQAGTVQTPPSIDNVMPRKEVSPEPNTATPQPNPNESGPTNPQATTQPQ